MKRHVITAATVVVLGLLAPVAAHADPKQECLDASERAQLLRQQHKPIAARGQLKLCARQECPPVVAKDCIAWFDEYSAAVPTVVLSAKDDHGAPLVDVRVTMDGKPLASKIDGRLLEVEPDDHLFVFERADGARAVVRVPVREAQKGQTVEATFAPAALPGGAAPGGAGKPRPNGFRTAGFVVGGVGLVGIAVGAVFGLMAVSAKSDANCNASNQCSAGPLADARSRATVSTVGFVAGGALLAGGLAMVVLAPRASDSKAARVVAAPMVAGNVMGLSLRGGF